MWVVVKIKVPFLGTLNDRCRIIIGAQRGTIILTTTHVSDGAWWGRVKGGSWEAEAMPP